MAASSSSKVAALANIFQSPGGADTPRQEEKEPVESGIKHYKNNLNLRRTSSQVARFSSAKKVFELKNKESLTLPLAEKPQSPGVSPSMTNTLPQRLCSPGLRSGSKIPIGEFWNDKKDKRLLLEKNSSKKESNEDLMTKIISEKSAQILQDAGTASYPNTFPRKVKSRHLKKYDDLTQSQELESPVLAKAEHQFTGLLETILSPEYRQAEQDFQRIADANISSDNLLDGAETSVDCGLNHGLLDDQSKTQDQRLQSTFKEFALNDSNIVDPGQASLDFSSREAGGEIVKEEDKTSDLSTPGANASSLGSSLEGQTVSSWLATTTNTTDYNTTTDSEASKKIESEGQVESSDYVSGDSCDFVTPKSQIGGEGEEFVEVKVHFLKDGHFWYEGSPLEKEDRRMQRTGSKVSFSTSPIRHFSTFSNEDYDRRNDDVDPEIASAEYELEKRLEKMELLTVSIAKEEDAGLGVSVLGVGAGVASEASMEKLGIFVKAIIPDGPVELDGRIKVGDQLVSVDGKSLVGVNQFEAADILNSTGEVVEIIIGRGEGQDGDDQVLQIIHQNNSSGTDIESQEDSGDSMTEQLQPDDGKKLFCLDLEKVNMSLSAASLEKCNEDNRMMMGGSQDNLPQDVSIFDVTDLLDENDEYFNEEDEMKVDKKFVSLPDPDVSEVQPVGSLSGEEQVINSVNAFKKDEIASNLSELPPCCEYKTRYESLLGKFEKSENLARQLSSDLKTVTSQLVSRDQTMQLYVENVEKLIMQDCKTETSPELVEVLVELRDKLGRPPHIPPEIKLPQSEFDSVLSSAQILNCQAAKDKIRLTQRSLAQRRSSSRFANISSKKLSLTTPLDNLFRRNRMRCSLPIMSKPRSHSCSNSISDSDAVSSASSVQSVPENAERSEQTLAKKKKSKSLIKQMKRRMSLSSYNKDQSQ